MTARRIPLYRENRFTTDGRIIESSTWPEDPIIPLMLASDIEEVAPEIIGTVSHLRRDSKTGWVSGVIKTPVDVKHYAAEAQFDQMDLDKERSNENEFYITSARLRAVVLGTAPAWPGMVI